MTRSLALTLCAVFIALTTAACTNVPELESKLNGDLRSADYPDLVPLDQAVEPLPFPSTQSAELEQQMTARSARLQKRAKALNAITE